MRGKLVDLTAQETPDGIKIITLAGRMDIPGTQQIESRFADLAASDKANVVVDLSNVSFLASIGMRTLVSSARALMNRGGAMALANPQPMVKQALLAAGIDSLVPSFADAAAATLGLQAAAQTD